MPSGVMPNFGIGGLPMPPLGQPGGLQSLPQLGLQPPLNASGLAGLPPHVQLQMMQMQQAQMQQAQMLQQLPMGQPPYLGGGQAGGGLPGVGYPNLGLDAAAQMGQMQGQMQGPMGQYTGMPTVMMANVGGVMQP